MMRPTIDTARLYDSAVTGRTLDQLSVQHSANRHYQPKPRWIYQRVLPQDARGQFWPAISLRYRPGRHQHQDARAGAFPAYSACAQGVRLARLPALHLWDLGHLRRSG